MQLLERRLLFFGVFGGSGRSCRFFFDGRWLLLLLFRLTLDLDAAENARALELVRLTRGVADVINR